MTIDTTKLRELAQKATPGPWRIMIDVLHFHSATTIYGGAEFPPPAIPAQMVVEIGGNAECADLEANTRYIAAANPETVLALLDELDRRQQEITMLRQEYAADTAEIAKLNEMLDMRTDEVSCRDCGLSIPRNHHRI